MRKTGGTERLLAVARRAPVHDPEPRPLRRARPAGPSAGGFFRLVSLAGRFLLRLGGRSRPLRAADIKSIAFIRLDDLGDVIQSTPMLRALKAWNPSARLTVYAKPACAEPLLHLACVDEVQFAQAPWIGKGSGTWNNLTACLRLASRLRTNSHDLVIDLRYHNRLDSLLISLCGARARLGFDAGGMGFWLTHRAPWPSEEHEADREAAALRRFGIPVEDLEPAFPMNPEEARQRVALPGIVRRGKGKRLGPLVAVHVGAGNPVKRWMPERFAWLARELAIREGARVAVLAGAGEESAGERLVKNLPVDRVLDMRGRLGVMDLAAVIAQADLFVGNDAGPAHISAALGRPTLIIFSGTSLARQWAPRGQHVRVLEQRVPCKPCHATFCPFDQACLRKVTVDKALTEARWLLARTKAASGQKREPSLGGVIAAGG